MINTIPTTPMNIPIATSVVNIIGNNAITVPIIVITLIVDLSLINNLLIKNVVYKTKELKQISLNI